jgi:undecaprenyl pyrophosphate synthase
VAGIKSPILWRVYRVYERRLAKAVKAEKVPAHVAIIMDGNRRFAEELGMDRGKGHQEGRNKLEELLVWCLELDIKNLTVCTHFRPRTLRGRATR